MSKNRTSPTIGVALGGGGIRGLAHLGVLQVLEEFDISIDFIAGTSMGGIIAGLYAAGVPIPKLIDFGETTGLANIASPDLSWRGLFGHKKMTQCLVDLLGRDTFTFDQLRIPAAVVAADIETGEMIVLDEGPLIPALLATSAFPLLFSPVHHQDRWLVDGGFLNNLPVDVVRSMGADFVVGVNVPPGVDLSVTEGAQSKGLSIRGLRFFSNPTQDWKTPFLIAETGVGLATQLVNERRLELYPPDALLEIRIPNVGILASDQARSVVEAGRQVAREHIQDLIKLEEDDASPSLWERLKATLSRLRQAGMAPEKSTPSLYPKPERE